jgi:lysozyme family protein
MDHAPLVALNRQRWQSAKLTRATEFAPVAKRLVTAKARYQEVERIAGVPWFVIAVIHQREASQRWDRSIAQGDPWDKVSTHVPKGRGPFAWWKDAALDALKHCAPYATNWKDWTPGGAMTLLELYNGLGYFRKGLPSPYVWSGTDQYRRGKYVADGVFDPNVIDQQLGCAGLILAMQALDPSIAFTSITFDGEPPPAPDIGPPVAEKPAGSLVLKILKFLFWKRS